MILGIYQPAQGVGHDTGVALVDRHGRILAAMSEERLSRVKMDGGFPFRALEMVLRMTGVQPADLDAVVVPFLSRSQQIREGAYLAAAAITQPSLIAGQWETQRGRDAFQAGMHEIGAYGYLQDFIARSRAVRDRD